MTSIGKDIIPAVALGQAPSVILVVNANTILLHLLGMAFSIATVLVCVWVAFRYRKYLDEKNGD